MSTNTCGVSEKLGTEALLDELERERLSTSSIVRTLYQIAVDLPAYKIIDLGVYGGGSTRAFLLACEETDGHVWSVELKPSRWLERTKQKVKEWGLEERWTLTMMDDLKYLDVWKNGLVDIVMIDTSHTYEHTLAELKAYSLFVRHGGLILLHDVAESKYEVNQAVDVFLKMVPFWNYCELKTRHGLGVLKRI